MVLAMVVEGPCSATLYAYRALFSVMGFRTTAGLGLLLGWQGAGIAEAARDKLRRSIYRVTKSIGHHCKIIIFVHDD